MKIGAVVWMLSVLMKLPNSDMREKKHSQGLCFKPLSCRPSFTHKNETSVLYSS